MQFSKLALMAVAATPAFAQIGGLDLPADLESYVESLEQNTAVAEALVGIITASQVQGIVQQILTATGDVNPTALAVSLEVAASQAIDAQPSSDRAIALSVLGVVTSLAANDGLISSVAGQITQPTAAPSANTTGSMVTSASSRVTGATTQAPSSGSNTAAAASSTQSSNLAAQPTGMALGAIVAGVAGIAMML